MFVVVWNLDFRGFGVFGLVYLIVLCGLLVEGLWLVGLVV